MKKVLSIILTIAMLFTVSIFAFADGTNGPMQKAKIKVGVSADFKPFEYYDENGELTGFDIDLMNYIVQRIGFDIEYVEFPFDRLFPAVASGEVNCAISALTPTEERDGVVDFTIPYLSLGENESYAIVFPQAAKDAQGIYQEINKAIKELIDDKTVEKLCEKYGIDENFAVGFEEEVSATSVPCSDWAKSDVEKAEALTIINDVGNYNFPAPITREEFCELIYNYCANVAGKLAAFDGENKFTDTDNPHILILNAMGIIKGKSETEFAPIDSLTREEAATILLRLINAVHPDAAATELYYEFTDSTEISDWAMNSIQVICNMGIMKGVGNNNFAPKEFYTTEQAIATIVRVFANFSTGRIESSNFADKLDAQMPKNKNYMFSPISIKMALSLAANGASGETQEQILNALGLSSLDEFNSISKDLIQRYSQTDILSLNIANSIWMNKDKTSQNFSNNFKSLATEYYNADVKSVNNSNAVKEINSWVSDKTNGKIPSIVQSADDFWAMLVNAIYFKGAWADEFNEGATKPDTFTDADGKEFTTDFMNKTKWFPYAKTKSVQIIELPYKNRVDKVSEDGEYLGTDRYDDLDVSMYLVMADENINVESELSSVIENNAFKSTYIKMSMPKFKIEYSTSLNEMLMNMDITTAFDSAKADFTKMFDKGNMWFTNVLHKTYISVDEKGTEAAAVTAIHMAGSALPPEPIELKFNKPFYFIIRDNTSGETLFMGRYAFAE